LLTATLKTCTSKTAKTTKGDIIHPVSDTVSVMRAISPFIIFAVFDVQVLKCCR